MTRRPPTPPLFPYTTLFRSGPTERLAAHNRAGWLVVDIEVACGEAQRSLRLQDRLPVSGEHRAGQGVWASGVDEVKNRRVVAVDRKSTRLNSSHMSISYAVF